MSNDKRAGSDSEPHEAAVDKGVWWALTRWEDVPKWMQDNHHIRSSYRQASYSYARSFASSLHLHNETVNIWSHGIPAILSLPTAYLLYSILKPRYEQASIGDVVTMGIFFASAALALGMSATYHTVSNHSPSVAKTFNQLDYAGIACLIAGSFVPCIYYGFWCHVRKQIIYWSMVSPGSFPGAV
jgi:adiponectin receptor